MNVPYLCFRGSRLVVSSLHVDRHPEWFGWALEAATRIPFRNRHDQCNNSPVALTFNPSNCRGTVFAVNGYRRYFHMYHRLLPGSLPRKQLSNVGRTNSNLGAIKLSLFLFMEYCKLVL